MHSTHASRGVIERSSTNMAVTLEQIDQIKIFFKSINRGKAGLDFSGIQFGVMFTAVHCVQFVIFPLVQYLMKQ